MSQYSSMRGFLPGGRGDDLGRQLARHEAGAGPHESALAGGQPLRLGGVDQRAGVGADGPVAPPTRQEWPLVAGVALLQMGAFTALALWALQYVAPGRASVIAYATSIWVIRCPRWY